MWWCSDVKLISGACCARVAIVCCRVEMVSDLGMSGIVPLRRSAIRRSLPSTGSRGSVPRLHQYFGALRLPAARPAALRPPSLGGTAFCARRSLPPAAERSRRRPGALRNRLPLVPVQRAETAGPRRFLGNPIADMPCSPTPVGPRRQAISAPRCCLPPSVTASAPTTTSLSRLDHTACPLAVYAWRPGLPMATQDSLPAAGHALPGGIGYPQGS